MAKKRQSIFDTPTPPKDIETAAKEAQVKSLDPIPQKSETKTKPNPAKKIMQKAEVPVKLAVVRLREDYHLRAKISATKKGMTLRNYMEHLIDSAKDE